MDYKQYFDVNKEAWNKRTQIHRESAFYGLEEWKKNNTSSLTPIESRELGDIAGKSILHLQCHFGQDTLSFARLGAAKVTGCDLSDAAIEAAQLLAAELNIEVADFVCCNVYDLRDHLKGDYDIVFTSYGTIGWLPELEPWAAVIAHFLKPGGYFYMADFHPVLWMMDDKMERLKYAYHNAGVIITEQNGTYADKKAPVSYTEYGWNHSFSELLNALAGAGLQLAFLNEYSYSPYNCFENTVKGADGNFRIKGLEDILPMVYSLKMHKPA